MNKTFAVVRHSRWDDTTEPKATVIVSYGDAFTWHDICTCDPEWADDIAAGLQLLEDGPYWENGPYLENGPYEEM